MQYLSDPIFLPWHGYTAQMATKPPTAHSMAMDDIWRSGNQRVIDLLNTSIRERLNTAPYPVVYVDDVNHPQLRSLILGAGYAPVPDARLEPLPSPAPDHTPFAPIIPTTARPDPQTAPVPTPALQGSGHRHLSGNYTRDGAG
ncbi:MAG TPA: hypothetical protein EYP98_03855 [Planctomycetes bacterium]|nr:hypothetical protein [Planctomycetota bacterium]